MVTTREQSVWGIHAGETGDADTLFLKHNVIALGWNKMNDLSTLRPDRESFKQRVASIYPDKKAGAIPVDAGQLFRFVYEMQTGDLVIYSSKHDRQIHIGKVEGAYSYNTEPEPHYPHHRDVRWVKALPRTRFSQGALYEIGAAMSFFQVKNFAEEFRAATEGKVTPTPVSADETVALVAEDIEQTTHDFILKRLAQELKGHPFAEFVASLLASMGYRTRVSPEGPDGGVDIIAHKDELGFEPPLSKSRLRVPRGASVIRSCLLCMARSRQENLAYW